MCQREKRDIEKGLKNVGNDAAFPLTNDLIIIMQLGSLYAASRPPA